MIQKSKILIIEDEEITALSLELFINTLGYQVTDCLNNYEDALHSIKNNPPNIIISDIIIKGFKSGIDIARDASQFYDISTIFITAHSTSEIINDIKGLPYCGYILKPFNKEELRVALELNLSTPSKLTSKGCNTLMIGNFLFQKDTEQLFLTQKEIALSGKMKMLLSTLCKSPHNYTPYSTIYQYIYPEDENINLDKLRHLIARLRKIIGKEHIHSNKNLGYCLNP